MTFTCRYLNFTSVHAVFIIIVLKIQNINFSVNIGKNAITLCNVDNYLKEKRNVFDKCKKSSIWGFIYFFLSSRFLNFFFVHRIVRNAPSSVPTSTIFQCLITGGHFLFNYWKYTREDSSPLNVTSQMHEQTRFWRVWRIWHCKHMFDVSDKTAC